MFPRPLSQCSNTKRPQFYQNQHNFVGRLPIDFFYFADFRWSFFGKMIGQKQRISLPNNNIKKDNSFRYEYSKKYNAPNIGF